MVRYRPFKTGKKMRKHLDNMKRMKEELEYYKSLSFFGKLIHLLKYNKI